MTNHRQFVKLEGVQVEQTGPNKAVISFEVEPLDREAIETLKRLFGPFMSEALLLNTQYNLIRRVVTE